MLKKIIVFSLSVLFFSGCDKTVQTTTTNVNNSAQRQTANDSIIVSGHSGNLSGAPQNSAAVVPKSETKTKWTQSGSPIDTSAFDAEIAGAEKDLKAKPKDEAAKKVLAEAFLKRGTALTEVGQYASALGDYRNVLKYDAGNDAAETWIKKIIEIYNSINREAPNAGEEPPPLPFERKS